MAALPNVAKVIKTIFQHGASTGENIFNILFWHYLGTNTDASMASFLATIDTQWFDHIVNNDLSTDTTFEGVEGIDLTSDISPTGFVSDGRTGGNGGSVVPINCCMLASHEISRRYRGGHPRTYFGGLPESSLNSPTQWKPASVSELTTDFGNFVNSIIGATFGGITIDEFVNVSYFTGHALRPVPVVDVVNDVVAKPRVCSQRRRLGKIGG